jgi:hypothetical protein
MNTLHADTRKTLDKMTTILKNDALTHGSYITDDIVNLDLYEQKAPCGGHKMCAVGTLWVAGGEATTFEDDEDYVKFDLPPLHVGHREEAVQRAHPSTRLAYELLNDAARKFGESKGFDMSIDADGDGEYEGAMEILFEIHDATAADLIQVTANAKRALTRLAKAAA